MNKKEIINFLLENYELEEVEELINYIKENLVDVDENNSYKEKYEKLKEKYIKRFKDGGETVKENVKEDNKKDDDNEEEFITYDKLVKEKE